MTANLKSDTAIPSVLQRIVATKHEEVVAARAAVSLEALKAQVEADTQPRRGFANALRGADIGIIAEIKKASPSKGIINHNFEPALFAKQYEQAGASCLSVLTDRDYFQGDDSYLIQARQSCNLPILRKDFMVDIYQIYQSYLMGADCIFVPGIKDLAAIAQLVREMPQPLTVVVGLMGVPFTVQQLADIGVRRITIGGSLARATYYLIRKAGQEMMQQGSFSYAEAQIPDGELCEFFANCGSK